MIESIFPWNMILTHMHKNKGMCKVLFGLGVITTGSGPCDEDEFDMFLRECGIPIYEISDNVPTKLVIGHIDWDEDEVRKVIQARAGGSLWVYSQEMVFASLAIGADVFGECSRDELISFGNGHPALEYLMTDMGFGWPITEVKRGINRLGDLGDIPEEGILGLLGYHVGKQGLSQNSRRKKLVKLLFMELTAQPYSNLTNIDEWGKPSSAQRLQKVANCLASFAILRKRNTTYDNSKAIRDYESDLYYLESNYFKPELGFRWPDTDVV